MRQPVLFAIFLVGAFASERAWAQGGRGCCCGRSPTFREAIRVSDGVVIARVIKVDQDANLGSDLDVLRVLKSHPAIASRQLVHIARELPVGDWKAPAKFILFGSVENGKWEPWIGLSASHEAVAYLEDLLKLATVNPKESLRYFVQHLGTRNTDILTDVLQELREAPRPLLADVGKRCVPQELRKHLQSSTAFPYLHPVCGLLLGYCGAKEDLELLEAAFKKQPCEEFLTAMVHLVPKSGVSPITKAVASAEFPTCYSGLRAIRNFYQDEPGVVSKKDLLALMDKLLDKPDIADFVIEDLRRWKRWEFADRVLGLAEKKTHDSRVVQRCILRFAIQCPNQAAARFVNDARARDSDLVADVEEILKLETE